MTRFILLILFLPLFLSAQEKGIVRVVGDSLVGKFIDGENIREVHGNVIITQDDVRITCNKAIQYLARNEAELIGNVIVIQDSISLFTDVGYYYGNSKIAHSKSGIRFSDGHISLNSKNGFYYFDENRAFFYGDVKLYDTASTLIADSLTYYNNDDKAIAVGNVALKDSASIVFTDSLIHLRNEKESFAFNNVMIYDEANRLAIFGNKLEDYKSTNISKISGNPFLVKIDTSSTGKPDTLIIISKMMEAFGDSTKKFVASDSVIIVRDDFASVNNHTIYYRDEQKLFTHREENELMPPVLWNEETQLIGDTINIYLLDNRLERMKIKYNSSIITPNQNKPFRFDQISGNDIEMFFNENGLERTEVQGNVLSIYYLYEENEPNGLLKSSSERAIIYFNENKVENVKLYGSPVSEFHPENTIEEKEKDFTIPVFRIVENKPVKSQIISEKSKQLFSLSEKIKMYGK